MAKTNGQKQQEAGKKASGHALASQVTNSPKRARAPPKERQSPITASTTSSPLKSPKKSKTAPTTISGVLATVEAMEDTPAVTVVDVLRPTSIESAPSTAAPVTVVNVSSSGASITDEEQNLINVHESSSIPKQGKGKDKDAGKKRSRSRKFRQFFQ